MKRSTIRTVVGVAVLGGALASGGCESAAGTQMLGEMFGVNALNARTAEQARGWQALSNVARFQAGVQAQQEVRQTPQTFNVNQR